MHITDDLAKCTHILYDVMIRFNNQICIKQFQYVRFIFHDEIPYVSVKHPLPSTCR